MAKSGAKAKATAKAKAQVATAKVAKKQQAKPATTTMGQSAKSKATSSTSDAASARKRLRCQEARRDLEQKVARALESGRLNHIPKSSWVGKMNSEGKTLPEALGDAFLEAESRNGKIGTRTWVRLFKDFELNMSVDLPEPDEEDGHVDDELLEVIAAATNENYVRANVVPLERYLEFCDPLSVTATYGLLQSLVPSPELSLPNAIRGQVAVLKMWGRTCHGGFKWLCSRCGLGGLVGRVGLLLHVTGGAEAVGSDLI